MKEKYRKLYIKREAIFLKFIEENSNKEITGPLLITPSQLYYNQNKRIMIIGQETKGWLKEWENNRYGWIVRQMLHTENFNLGEKYGCSPFWSFFRKFEELLGNDKYSTLWTNLHKFDLKEGRLDSDCRNTIKEINKILIEEIEIGQPNICIFHTSHNRDEELKEIFEGLEFIPVEGWDIKCLSILKHPKLPKFSIRTYHPNYLRQKRKETDFFETIKKFNLSLMN